MKYIRLIGSFLALFVFVAACGKNKDASESKGNDDSFPQYSKAVKKLFNEKNDRIDSLQKIEDTAQVLNLLDIVNRMRESEPGSASGQLRQQLLQRAPKMVEEVNIENCMDLAFASLLADNTEYREAVFTFLLENPELELQHWFHLNELFEGDEGFQPIIVANADMFTDQLDVCSKQLRRLYASSISSIPPSHQIAELSNNIILVSLLLGKEEHLQAYELGVEHLLNALNRFGRFGELNAGLTYAQLTMNAVAVATRAMMLNDDDRAFNHNCWLNMADWLIHLLQPGRLGVNYGDAHNAARQARNGSSISEVLANIAWLREDPIALWALKYQFDGYPASMAGYGAALHDGLETKFEPLPYGYFPQAGLLVWRNHWGDDSSGLWIRGGDPADVYDHEDRGHLSFTLNGKPILWDCGMPPSPGHEMDSEYRSFRSHNVLSVNFNAPKRANAPFVVRLLDENRGNVRVDASQCYKELARWNRDVFWRANDELRIVDDLSFKIGERGRVAFRWHLAERNAVDLVRNNRRFIVETDDFAIVIEANETIVVSQTVASNYSLTNTQENSHIVLLIESVGRPLNLRIITRIIPKD